MRLYLSTPLVKKELLIRTNDYKDMKQIMMETIKTLKSTSQVHYNIFKSNKTPNAEVVHFGILYTKMIIEYDNSHEYEKFKTDR